MAQSLYKTVTTSTVHSSATRRPSAPLPAVETKAARQVPSEFI